MTDFVDIRFPEHISYGSVGGPGFKTSVATSGSGREQRNQQWARSRATYDAKYGVRTEEQMAEVIKFFYARRGMAIGFRFKDWTDYKIEDQNFGVGDGSETSFQMFKRYESGDGEFYDREIKKLVEGTVTGIKANASIVDPADYSIDVDTGIVTFTSAPADTVILSIDYIEFDVPVRFDLDDLPVTMDAWDQQSIGSIPMVELRI